METIKIFKEWLYKEYTSDIPKNIINILEKENIPKK